MKTRIVLAVTALALFATACGGSGGGGSGGGGSGGGGSGTATAGARPSSTATLAIVEPANEATVAPGPVTVRLDLQGARIVSAATTVLKPDEGHVHLSLDGTLVSMAYGLEQAVDVGPGVHQLVAEFVAGDHAPFNPRVLVTRTFAVTTTVTTAAS